MHTLRLLLHTTKADETFIETVFVAIAEVHNSIVREGKKRLRVLNRSKRYRYARKHYGMTNGRLEEIQKELNKQNECLTKAMEVQKKAEDALLQAEKGQQTAAKKAVSAAKQNTGKCRKSIKELEAERKALEKEKARFSGEMNAEHELAGTTKNAMEAYAGKYNKKYKGVLNSQQIQVEADRVWAGMEKVIYGNGKDIHYKKWSAFRTVRGKQAGTGIRFRKDTLTVEWLGHSIAVAYQKKLQDAAVNGTAKKDLLYKLESMAGEIKYCEIVRMEFKDGWHYYANLYIDGDAPKKNIPGEGVCGIDPGVSSLAATADKHLTLEELAPEYKKYDRRIHKLQKKADALRRRLNPQNYNEDGTVKKMPKKERVWHTNPRYDRLMREIRVLSRRKSDYTGHLHSFLCNRLIQQAGGFLVEKTDFSALAKRAGETSRSDRTMEVVMADGTKKTVVACKRKKRFGRSVNSRSPALVLTILKRKCAQYGLTYEYTNTVTMKTSQYDHTSGECKKHALNERFITLSDGSVVQRDLYSSFLQKHADADRKTPDREACIRDFPSFLELHNKLIETMKAEGISMKQCFGF